jgi:hypothetical protein
MPTCANLCCVSDGSLCSFRVARCLVDRRNLPHGPFPARAVEAEGLSWYRSKNIWSYLRRRVVLPSTYQTALLFWELCLPGTPRDQACMQAFGGASRHKQSRTVEASVESSRTRSVHFIQDIDRYRG